MTKKQSKHHQSKQAVNYDLDGICFAELTELALDRPLWFLIVCQMIKFNFPQRLIKIVIRKII
jgi:hypothetical protein